MKSILVNKLSLSVAEFVSFILKFILPLLPLMAAVLFWKKDYIAHYRHSLKKINIHVRAICDGPLQHYFQDILFFNEKVEERIIGYCSQCGNCCLNRQCFFLEQSDKDTYICGIYKSPLRRFSNCSSFPINGNDIERYQCPTYNVILLKTVI